MFNWKPEEMRLLNMKVVDGVFACESKVSREEKIAFIDKYHNGIMSRIVDLGNKFLQDKDYLKRDEFGEIETKSFRAWLKRNNGGGLIDEYGVIEFYGHRANIKNYPYMHSLFITKNQDIVDVYFNGLLNDCLVVEKAYFYNHDPYNQLTKQVCNKLGRLGYQSLHLFDDLDVCLKVRNDHYGKYNLAFIRFDREERVLTFDELKTFDELLDSMEDSYIKVQEAQEQLGTVMNDIRFKMMSILK